MDDAQELSDKLVTPELIGQLLGIHARWKDGTLSTLEAAIEQMEVCLQMLPDKRSGRVLIDALKDYNDGDSSALDALLSGEDC